MPSFRETLRSLARSLTPRTYEALVRLRARRAADRSLTEEWERRASDVMACPDNARLPRHPDAGRVVGGMQTMFNGIRVFADGYYGAGMTRLLRLNRGSHEPQEEVVFKDVLGRLSPGSRIVECGAYWGFYSLWLLNEIPGAQAWLIEPDASNLEVGRRNFAANHRDATFVNAFVAGKVSTGSPSTVAIDEFLADRRIEHLEILHADIQGSELEMIHGARTSLSKGMIDYMFISTHGEDLHLQCVEELARFGYEVPVSIRPAQSYSFDGLIVANRGGVLTTPLVQPSAKPTGASN